MLDHPIKQTIQKLHNQGDSIREISRKFNLSRNTVRFILRQTNNDNNPDIDGVNVNNPAKQELITLITPLLVSCKGNLVRIKEELAARHDKYIPYSTLTYIVRKYQLRESKIKRFGEYVFEPGIEMQHDTSPHDIIIADKKVKAQCASLIFGYSRMLFIQYYPKFTRFEAKVFLSTALEFMQASCRRCIIDNTSVILASGAGTSATISAEMLFFSRTFGFTFIAHAVGDPNRKGKIEKPFSYAENNFLAGRTFTSWTDLNAEARSWCQNVANYKPKRSLMMISPERIYLHEQPFCLSLPEVMPPVYKHTQRTVDTAAYISLETHRYSVPEKLIGQVVNVYQYIDKIEVFYNNQCVAAHSRLIGKPYQRSRDKTHHKNLHHKKEQLAYSEAERQLGGYHPTLDEYIQQLKSKVRGRGHVVFKHLLHLKQLYPLDAFISAITQAKKYGLYDMKRLETIILRYINSDFFNLE